MDSHWVGGSNATKKENLAAYMLVTTEQFVVAFPEMLLVTAGNTWLYPELIQCSTCAGLCGTLGGMFGRRRPAQRSLTNVRRHVSNLPELFALNINITPLYLHPIFYARCKQTFSARMRFISLFGPRLRALYFVFLYVLPRPQAASLQ